MHSLLNDFSYTRNVSKAAAKKNPSLYQRSNKVVTSGYDPIENRTDRTNGLNGNEIETFNTLIMIYLKFDVLYNFYLLYYTAKCKK